MKTKIYLGFDFGASSGRAVIGRLAGRRLSLKEIHRFPNAPLKANGVLRWDFPGLWHQVLETLAYCGARGYTPLSGMGIDTWGVDFGLLGNDGELIANPLCYRDRITVGSVEAIARAMGAKRVYKLTGLAPGRVSTLAQLVGLRRSSDKAGLERAATLLMMPDLFRFRLCGHKSVERTIAGSSILVDLRSGQWSDVLFKRLGLPRRIMPALTPPATVVGHLHGALAATAGINRPPVVAVCGHDTLSAAAAAPYVDAQTAFISSGTWSVVGVIRKEPITTLQAMRLGYINEIGLDSILFAKNMVGLYLLENLRRRLEREGFPLSNAALVQTAGKETPFAGYLDVNAPEFFVCDDPAATIARFLRRTGQKPVRGWPATARLIIEGIAWSFRQAMAELAELTSAQFKRICLVGGGSRNRLLCQMTADATGLELLAGPAEATVAGNLAVQALATGRLKGPESIRALVRNSFKLESFEPRNTAMWAKTDDSLPCEALAKQGRRATDPVGRGASDGFIPRRAG
ncbi:MAG: rhamnulokinase [Lentisphaerae bacterium]|nr:rhamnulokinase [Lentisphaerota bacterium]